MWLGNDKISIISGDYISLWLHFISFYNMESYPIPSIQLIWLGRCVPQWYEKVYDELINKLWLFYRLNAGIAPSSNILLCWFYSFVHPFPPEPLGGKLPVVILRKWIQNGILPSPHFENTHTHISQQCEKYNRINEPWCTKSPQSQSDTNLVSTLEIIKKTKQTITV